MKLTVVSFNIRYCDDPNGHSIPERAPRLGKAVLPIDADLIGFQEYTPAWADHIDRIFGEKYEIFNKYRSEKSPESAPILWKKDKFELLKTGYFWLSDTPEVESKGWDEVCHCHRICEYVTLRDVTDGKVFTYMNTHYGFGDNGHIKSARLIYDYSKRIGDAPTVLTGDFNMYPNSLGYGEIVKYFTDVNAATAKSTVATFHNYDPEKNTTAHIDYCFVNEKVKPLSWKLIDNSYEGKYPSDHFGIKMTLEI